MSKNWRIQIIIVLAFVFLLAACGKEETKEGVKDEKPPVVNEAPPAQTPAQTPVKETPPPEPPPKVLSGEIEIWLPVVNNQILEAFNKKYPQIKVNKPDISGRTDKFIAALATGTGAPDIMQMSSSDWLLFKNVAGLEDLTKSPYNADRYKQDFPKINWDATTAMDDKKLYAMPWFLEPYITFYRMDVIESNGFPADPEGFGKLIANEESFFEMAQVLAVKGYKFFRWEAQVIDFATERIGFYDHKLNYLRNNDTFVKAIETAKRAVQLDLITPVSSGDTITQMLNEGKLVTYMNTPNYNFITNGPKENWGKWRVTTSPFGTHGGRGLTALAIPSQSKNKELAWAFIEWLTTSDEANTLMLETKNILTSYKKAWTLPIVSQIAPEQIGGQKLFEFTSKLMNNLSYPVGSPIDNDAEDAWDHLMGELAPKNMDARAMLAEIYEQTERHVSVKKEELMKELGLKK